MIRCQFIIQDNQLQLIINNYNVIDEKPIIQSLLIVFQFHRLEKSAECQLLYEIITG